MIRAIVILWPGALALLLALALCGACSEDEDLDYAPADCLQARPEFGYLDVEVTIDAEHDSVPIVIYRGEFEDDVVVEEYVMTAVHRKFELAEDEDYAVTAHYIVGPDTIMVLDGDRISTDEIEYRDAYCWEVNDGDVDLRLDLE
jgi:hypothetical protein